MIVHMLYRPRRQAHTHLTHLKHTSIIGSLGTWRFFTKGNLKKNIYIYMHATTNKHTHTHTHTELLDFRPNALSLGEWLLFSQWVYFPMVPYREESSAAWLWWVKAVWESSQILMPHFKTGIRLNVESVTHQIKCLELWQKVPVYLPDFIFL